MTPIFSIIIPNKNNPDLLLRCINSIPEREDLEVIIVDDCSDSSIIDFNKYPGRNKANVKIYQSASSLGAGNARNIGLDQASGRWVLFADSDDTFITQALNSVLDKYSSAIEDVIYFDIVCRDAITMQSITRADKQYRNLLNHPSDAINLCRYMILVPWGKLIKKELIDKYNLKFDCTRVGNDAWFSLNVGINASSVLIDKTQIYNWLIRNNSTMSIMDKDSVNIRFNLDVRLNQLKEMHKLYKYRKSLFLDIPMLMRGGYLLKDALGMVLCHINKRYIFRDIIVALKYKL